MRKIKNIFCILVSLCAFSACGGGGSVSVNQDDTLYMPRYAEGFAIYRHGNSSILTVTNPWQGAEGVAMSLFLAREGEVPPKGFKGAVVEAPVKKVVCMSSTHVAFLDAVGAVDAVSAVSGARFISNDTIRARHARGEVGDVGYDVNLNYELVASLKPDIVLVYGVAGENSSMTRKLDEMGVRYIYIGDYVEQDPLGKAEWVVAFGEMTDRRERAEALFGQVCDSYNATREMVLKSDSIWLMLSSSGRISRPGVMLNAPYRDTWFVPGDRSYMVRLIGDAGGEYVCAGVDSDMSRPISGESAFVYAQKAHVWLNPGQADSMKDVIALNPKFADIRPVRDGRVYNCNKRSTDGGGSDFWESGAVRPDIVLKDMVKILRSGMGDLKEICVTPEWKTERERELFYFKKME